MRGIVLAGIALCILGVSCEAVDVNEWENAVGKTSEEEEETDPFKDVPRCGENKFCVPPVNCLNGLIDRYGSKVLGPRSTVCEGILECCELQNVGNATTPPSELQPPPGCGYRNTQGVMMRLMNKTNEAEFGEFPWMVLIFVDGNDDHFGGSILHPKVVLTAAHRMQNKRPSKIKVRAGEWERNGVNEPLPHQDRGVRKIILHKDFRSRTYHNNVALLVLDSPFVLSAHIGVVCLPPAEQNFINANCIVPGWGRTAFTSKKYANILKRIELKVVPKETCQANLRKTILGPRFTLQDSHLCAGVGEGGDSCFGDGGSALVCPIPNTENRYYVAGVVSAGLECGRADAPGIYASMVRFRTWIDDEFKIRNFIRTYLP